jgi:hypothetical protein
MPEGPSARETLQAALMGLSVIHDPILGKTTPATLAQSGHLWPGSQWSAVLLMTTTNAAGRRIEEYVYTGQPDGLNLPVVLVIDKDVGRLYSDHALTRSREVILPLDDSISASAEPGDFLDGYFEHLETAALEESIGMFEPDGYIRHSNGERFQGPERLREDYTNMFKSNGGRIRVRFANVTDDGKHRAFECVMPSGRPAIAIYERGTGGKIAAIRISL